AGVAAREGRAARRNGEEKLPELHLHRRPQDGVVHQDQGSANQAKGGPAEAGVPHYGPGAYGGPLQQQLPPLPSRLGQDRTDLRALQGGGAHRRLGSVRRVLQETTKEHSRRG
ncbi:unnamed protein product, partial [Ectocarpus fasciculatus]